MSPQQPDFDEDAVRRAFEEGFDDPDGAETAAPAEKRAPELEHPPLQLGVIRDVVGHVPAGPNNCDIYYTETNDGEDVAAVTLLTQKLMPMPVVEHLKAVHKSFVCTGAPNGLADKIYHNIKFGRPVTEIRAPGAVAHDPENDDAVGRTNVISPIMIQQLSRNDVLDTLTKGFAKLMASMSKEDDVPEEVHSDVAEVAEENDLYVDIYAQGATPGKLKLQDVVDAGDDPVKLTALMRTVQADRELNDIPMTVCHEIGHVGRLQNAMMPASSVQTPLAAAFAQVEFAKKTLVPDLLAAQALPQSKRRGLGYYLGKKEEAQAQIIGESIMQVMEENHGIQLQQPGLTRAMPNTARFYQQAIKTLQAPQNGTDPSSAPTVPVGPPTSPS